MQSVEVKWLTARDNCPDQALVFVGEICSCLCTIYHNGKATIMMVDNVQTKDEYQNKGYGTALINQVIKSAKDWGVDAIELTVNSSNGAAKRVYGKVGFSKTDKEHYRIVLNEWPKGE